MKIVKNNLILILLILISIFSLNFNPTFSQGKITIKEKEVPVPICSGTGELSCPTGYKPICPKQYKPKCIFVTNKQRPACLADSSDKTFYSYYLDKISCKKK